MAKTKNFILEVLKALFAGSGNGGNEIEDNDVSSLIEQNTDIIKKTNAYNENAALELDSIYNFFATNKDFLKSKTNTTSNADGSPVVNKSVQSPIPNIDNFFEIHGYIPVMVLNPGYGGNGGFDVDLPGRIKSPRRPTTRTPRPRPARPISRTPNRPAPGSRPGGFNPNGSPSTGGPARYPRVSPNAILPGKYTRNSAGQIINSTTGRYVSHAEVLDGIAKSDWAKYRNLIRFLKAASAVGVIVALLDPLLAMANGEPESEVKKQLAGALGSIGGATLGAIIGAAGITAIPVVGQSGIANIAGALIGGIAGSVGGEWVIESLVEYLLDTSSTTEVQQSNPMLEFEEDFGVSSDPMGVAIPYDFETPELTSIEDIEPSEPVDPYSQLIPTETDSMLTPASFNAHDYAEQETSPVDRESKTIQANEIHFLSDVIRFVYNTLGDGTYYENSNPLLQTGEAELISASFPSGGMMDDTAGMSSPQGEPATPGGGMTTPDLPGNASDSKQFLASISANRNRPGDTSMLNDDFAERLARLIQSAPAGIRQGLGVGSAYRSAERQAEIISENMGRYGFGAGDRSAWNSDVASMGPEAAGEKWRSRFRAAGLTANIGMPGGSRHQHGLAVDLTYNGTMLRPGNVPPDVLSWVHANAGNFGLHFPMGHEPWHIEPVTARADQPTVMAGTDTPATAGNVASPSTADATTVPPAGGNSPETTAPSAAPAGNSVTTGQDIAERSTETYANARIGNPTFAGSAGVTATGAPIITASTIDPPYETAGIDKPIAAMTATEQSIFERSGLFA